MRLKPRRWRGQTAVLWLAGVLCVPAVAAAQPAQHAGEIAAQSTPGVGTVLTVLLPVIDRPQPPPPDPTNEGERSGVPALDKVTVLVVEDDPAVLKVAHDMLVSKRLQVLVAQRTDEAVRLAESSMPGPSICC